MSLSTIAATFEAAADAEWTRIKTEAITIEQEIVPEAESAFESLVTQFAPLVMSTISNLATAAFVSLSGGEKLNLAATTIVDTAAQQGVTIAAADASALVKNGFEAFQAAAPAVGAPAQVVTAAETALATGEAVVEGAISSVAAKAEAEVTPAPAGTAGPAAA